MVREWGDPNPQGHRARFCIPVIAPRAAAYNIFERQTCRCSIEHGFEFRVDGVEGWVSVKSFPSKWFGSSVLWHLF